MYLFAVSVLVCKGTRLALSVKIQSHLEPQITEQPIKIQSLDCFSTSGCFLAHHTGARGPKNYGAGRRRAMVTPQHLLSIPGSSDGKESACNAWDPGSIPGSGISPEKGRASHSSILENAWRIPWTGEPGGLQSMGSQIVGHDWATNTLTFHNILNSRRRPLHWLVCVQLPGTM